MLYFSNSTSSRMLSPLKTNKQTEPYAECPYRPVNRVELLYVVQVGA